VEKYIKKKDQKCTRDPLKDTRFDAIGSILRTLAVSFVTFSFEKSCLSGRIPINYKLTPMRVLVSIALLIGLNLPLLLADFQPTTSTVIGSAGSSLVDASFAVPSMSTSPENFALRVFAMLTGIFLMGVSAYMAFGRRQRTVPAKISGME
jgi:O-antigen ligase